MRALTTLVAVVAVVLAGCGGDEPAAPGDDGLRGRRERRARRAGSSRGRRRQRQGRLAAECLPDRDSEVGDDPRLLDLTLGAGADVDAKDSFNGTGLIRAAERGHASIVARLLETDIDLDHVNRLGWTALLEAVILGEGGRPHVRTVRLLVEAGADVDIPDESGTTALAHARRLGFTAIERILVEAGARAA